MNTKDVNGSTKLSNCKLSLPKLPFPSGKGWGWGFFFFFFSVFTGFAQQTIELNNWKFKTGDNLEWAQPGLDDSAWKPIHVGSHWEIQGYKGYDGYAWYRVKFNLPSSLKKNAYLDSLRFMLGKIDDHDQTFLNGCLLGQNAKICTDTACRKDMACHVPKATIPDLSKTPMAWDDVRCYAIPLNDPRLKWDQENTIAIRVYDAIYDGGIYTTPVNITLQDLSYYLVFDIDSRKLETNPGGTLSKTITLTNNLPSSGIKGKLQMEFADAGSNRKIASKTFDVDMPKGAQTAFTCTFKGDLFQPMATYTFTEAGSKSKVVHASGTACSPGWVKYEYNPVLGGHLGIIFDVNVLQNDKGVFQMFCSWRDKKNIALSESADGLKWSSPVAIFNPVGSSGSWEKEVNRPCVVLKDGVYHMWYTAEVWTTSSDGHAAIGYAVSNDGLNWVKKSEKPVMIADVPWEKTTVRTAHVLWDGQEKAFKMWYSGGEAWEPDAIGYASSKDGIHWEKYKNNPVFASNKQFAWEEGKVAGCQVIKREHDYLMFYIGYKTAYDAQIGMARSKDGITNWERYKENPVIRCVSGFDSDAAYKPYAIPDEENKRWLLYYNGHGKTSHEQMGVAIHKGMDLGF